MGMNRSSYWSFFEVDKADESKKGEANFSLKTCTMVYSKNKERVDYEIKCTG